MCVNRLALVLVFMVAATSGAVEPIDIGTRLEPLVDDYLIDSLRNVKQTLHEPIRREVAIVHDCPWEGNLTTYHTVFQDGDLYRMYYRGWNLDGKNRQFSHEYVCYAESKDGIRWTKPKLEICEFEGSKQNNIVWAGPEGTHAFAPFKDTNPACKPEQQYKALGPIMGTSQKQGGLGAFQSPDGIHWSPMQEKPVITKGAFDSLNLAFWDATRQRYVDFHRDGRDGRRDVVTCTSADFVHWTDPIWLECPGRKKKNSIPTRCCLQARTAHFPGFPDAFRWFAVLGIDGGRSLNPPFPHAQSRQAERFRAYRRALHDEPGWRAVPPLERSLHPSGIGERLLDFAKQLAGLGRRRNEVRHCGRHTRTFDLRHRKLFPQRHPVATVLVANGWVCVGPGRQPGRRDGHEADRVFRKVS